MFIIVLQKYFSFHFTTNCHSQAILVVIGITIISIPLTDEIEEVDIVAILTIYQLILMFWIGSIIFFF